MRLTPSLYVRKLLATLHPPLPPQSARESKQLLNVLEAAFRKHLDELHPSPNNPKDHAAKDHAEFIPDPAQKVTRSTHAHLDSILSHPLLRQQHTTYDPEHGLAASAVATFESAMVSKKLDSHLVQSCAMQYLQGLKQKETVASDAKLGPRLIRWFTSMSTAEKKQFLVHEKRLDPIVWVLYADGHEPQVWEWLRMLYERSLEKSTPLLSDHSAPGAASYARAEDRLVASMIKQSIRRGQLQEAAQQYIQASEYRVRTGRSAMTYNKVLSRPLTHAWQQLARGILGRRRHHQLSGELIDAVLKYGVGIYLSPLDHNIIRLYHPVSPSPTPLCRKLKEPAFQQHFSKWQEKVHTNIQRGLLVAMLDAAQLSLEQNNPAEARELLDFAETHFPDVLKTDRTSDPTERLKHAQNKILVRSPFRESACTPNPVLG